MTAAQSGTDLVPALTVWEAFLAGAGFAAWWLVMLAPPLPLAARLAAGVAMAASCWSWASWLIRMARKAKAAREARRAAGATATWRA
jgi:hypothetical protein